MKYITFPVGLIICGLALLLTASCNKAEFLNKKSSTRIITPETLEDFQKLLDGTAMNAFASGLPTLSSDDIEVSASNWASASVVQRNAYTWEADIYQGESDPHNWYRPYQVVFYANVVLEGLAERGLDQTVEGRYIRGQALFKRGFAYYDLARNFCKPYDATSAESDLGLPIRLKPGVDEVFHRSSLKETYDQFLSDILEATEQLPSERLVSNLYQPWRGAAYALLSRIYLDMREYDLAQLYVDSCLMLYDRLIDYNTLDQTSITPFPITHDELIYNAMTFGMYTFTGGFQGSPARISQELIQMYDPDDLRLSLFFTLDPQGKRWKTRGYGGQAYPFTGLATDELYLIKAECLARGRQVSSAMEVLNTLRQHRFDNFGPYNELVTTDPDVALQHVLNERRRQLVWRGLRWQDIKRLNMEGAGITLKRNLDGEQYVLPPNSDRYVFPIPDEEVTSSGITQNIR